MGLSHEARRRAIGNRHACSTSPATPLMVDGMMYLATPYSSVIALKPETGELIWTYKLAQSRFMGRIRHLLAGRQDHARLPLLRHRRWPPAFFERKDRSAHMPSLARTGFINLKAGMTDDPNQEGRYSMTSAASIYKNLIITGADLPESPAKGPSGDIRAWDVHTGKTGVAFPLHPARRARPVTKHGQTIPVRAAREPMSGASRRSTPNVAWSSCPSARLRPISTAAIVSATVSSATPWSFFTRIRASSPGISRRFITTSTTTIWNLRR